jgi:chromosome segregation ATPase
VPQHANPPLPTQRRDHAPDHGAPYKPVHAGHTHDSECSFDENLALRARVEELERQLASAQRRAEQGWAERQQEYESLLEEKSQVIRGLHQKLVEIRDSSARAEQAKAVDAMDPVENEDLARLKRELDEQRRQMEEDEESMMAQLRQLEMALAKDRADLARQRNELERLRNEFAMELEASQRGSELRERLGAIQRRCSGNGHAQNIAAAAPIESPEPTANGGKSKQGLLRRLFS